MRGADGVSARRRVHARGVAVLRYFRDSGRHWQKKSSCRSSKKHGKSARQDFKSVLCFRALCGVVYRLLRKPAVAYLQQVLPSTVAPGFESLRSVARGPTFKPISPRSPGVPVGHLAKGDRLVSGV